MRAFLQTNAAVTFVVGELARPRQGCRRCARRAFGTIAAATATTATSTAAALALFVGTRRGLRRHWGNVRDSQCGIDFDGIFLGLALDSFTRRSRLLRLRRPAVALLFAAVATLAFLASLAMLALAPLTDIVVFATFARFAVAAATRSRTIARRGTGTSCVTAIPIGAALVAP